MFDKLNRDIIKLILLYLDHDSMRVLCDVYMKCDVITSCVIFRCALSVLIEEREFIEKELIRLNDRFSSVIKAMDDD